MNSSQKTVGKRNSPTETWAIYVNRQVKEERDMKESQQLYERVFALCQMCLLF